MDEIKKFENAAKNGDSDAMYELAKNYANESYGNDADDDDDENHKKALYWYEKAAKAGNVKSMLELAANYRFGFCGFDKDKEKAFNWYKKAADLGSPKALDKIGSMYQSGEGVSLDYAEAVKYYKQAAELEYTESMNNLARCLIRGLGINKNVDEGINWYKKSIALGDNKSMKQLAIALLKYKGAEENEAEAFELLKKYRNANKGRTFIDTGGIWESGDYSDGNLKAMEDLAWIYRFEMPDTKENKSKAFKLYKKLAEVDGRYGCELAEMYFNGKGVEKNLEEAVKWYKKAAALGDSMSMLYLAEFYIKGEGVPQDETEALDWLIKRYDGNKIDGMYELALIYYGKKSEYLHDENFTDKKKAFEWFQKLYELNNEGATFFLGQMYERGEYVEKDKIMALEIYKKGVELGNADCCRSIIEIYLDFDGDGSNKNIPEAVNWIVKYFNTANEAFCTCPFCSPFQAMKVIAKFFIDTPNDEIVKLYDDDEYKAAEAVFKFGQACEESSINISITLDVISIAADIIDENCSVELLEHLIKGYEKLYQEAKNGFDKMQEDEGERITKEITESLNNYFIENDENYNEGSVTIDYDDGNDIKFEHHSAGYYKSKAIHFQTKLALHNLKIKLFVDPHKNIDDIKKISDFFGKHTDDEIIEIYDGNKKAASNAIKELACIYEFLYKNTNNQKQKNKYKQKSTKWRNKAKKINRKLIL